VPLDGRCAGPAERQAVERQCRRGWPPRADFGARLRHCLAFGDW